jgi:hypothetical protein
MDIILLAIFVGIIMLILYNYLCKNKENFIDINKNIITFTRIDGVLIKSYNIDSFYSVYGDELNNIFNSYDIIKVNIPLNYSITLRYALKNDTTIIDKVFELPHGTYDIYKLTNDKIINQIDIKNMISYNNHQLAKSNIGIPYYWDTDTHDSFRPEYYPNSSM